MTPTRTVVAQNSTGGVPCGDLTETTDCNLGPCPVNCHVDSFGAWETCSVTCGGGTQTRSRGVQHQASENFVCPYESDQRACNAQACDLNCRVSEWGDYTVCSKSCNTGEQIRYRTVLEAHGNF